MLEGFHLRVAQSALSAIGQEDFALGGGYALQVHGISQRDSDDLDAYSPHFDGDVFERAEVAILAQLRADGFSARIGSTNDVFRQVLVTDPLTGEEMVVDLGYDSRHESPVVIQGIGPVIAIDDAVGSKARALNDRRAARDYFDLNGVLQLPGWDVERLYAAFSRFRQAPRAELAADMRLAHEVDPDDYLAFGMNIDEMDAMYERLANAADDLESGPPDAGTGGTGDDQPRKPADSADGGQFDSKRQSSPEVGLR